MKDQADLLPSSYKKTPFGVFFAFKRKFSLAVKKNDMIIFIQKMLDSLENNRQIA